MDILTHSATPTNILVMPFKPNSSLYTLQLQVKLERTIQQGNELYNHWYFQYWGKTPMILSERIISLLLCINLKNASLRSHDVGSDWIQPHIYTVPPLCLALFQATTISHQLYLHSSSVTQLNCKQRIDSLRYIIASIVLRGAGASIQEQRKFQSMRIHWWTTLWIYCVKVRNT